MTKNNSKKHIIIGLVVLLVILAGLLFAYTKFKPTTSGGNKTITVTVVDSNAEEKNYTVKTDAEYLQQALDDTEGLTYKGSEGDYGLMITEVNGESADFNKDKAYWSFYVNGEYCNYGIAEQPVADGDEFKIVYETQE
ncbi:DUF4430 domain-containing protein [Clostridium sp. C105KSO13]|uniref:DUF4430 domain-containing protein n=1 Tax=Clostridium sp. C105KSO13 TaxID=1776045 RepID=UPI000740629F|nr:DUF4430 domain-containing protein [Clostridium sp. C105KSO13]CUX42906.1 hypothetical protein BN3456_02288 [Clostridium sp. C105KSO13]